MTVIGNNLVTACHDGTVSIHDSITGVMRLSLTTRNSVRAIGGSVDGSILFCTHQQPLITSWDIQTGGLIHTFVLEGKVEDVAVSSRGRYLACGLSDGSVKVWEVANNVECGALWSGSPVSCLCWLGTEEQLAVAKRVSVHTWDVVSGSILRRIATQDPIRGMLYSQKLNQLAVITTSATKGAVTIVDLQEGKWFTSEAQQEFSCFAFSQTTGEVVCGGIVPGLELFNVKKRSWRHLDQPTVASISMSSNWTVTNVVGSGIQLLDLGWQHTPPRQLAIPALAVDAFDEGRIIALLSITKNRTLLLESTAMSQLFTIPTQNTNAIHTDRTPVLCAAIKHRIAVCCLREGDKWRLWLWRKFDRELPEWTMKISGLPSIGGISPSGGQLVTFHDMDQQTHICVRDTQNGRLQAHLPIDQSSPAHPLGIKFESEDKFYSHHHSYHIPYVISSSNSGTPNDSIIRYQQLPFAGESRRYYNVDDAREWVVASSKRVCWIPPGYIGSGQSKYCWAGSALVMVGEDGTLRAIRFREPFN